jgi:hypothetical protein
MNWNPGRSGDAWGMHVGQAKDPQTMNKTIEETNKRLVLDAVDTLSNIRDYESAAANLTFFIRAPNSQ